MSSNQHLPRRYSDDEVTELLKRATDIQHADPSHRPGTGGITLAELQEVALEAGIDPKHLQRAAAELDTPRDLEISDKLAGTRLTVVAERVVPGELSDGDFSKILPEIQRASPGHGNASMVGTTLTWSSDTTQRMRSLQVTVACSDGETLIRAEERLHGLAGSLFGGLMGGFGGGVGIGVGLPVGIEALGSVAFAVAFPIGVLTTAYLAARGILKHTGKKRRRELEAMVDRIAAHVQPAPALPAAPSSSAALPESTTSE